MEKRKASHPQKPHATSQPSRFSHTPTLSTALLRSTLCARGWPSATPDDGPPQAGGAGDCCVSPLRRVVSMVLCGSARLLSQPACSISPPVLLLGFAAGCVGCKDLVMTLSGVGADGGLLC